MSYSDEKNTTNTMQHHKKEASLLVQNLSYHYGKKQALNGIDLNLQPGVNYLLGPNGAGKSTLFSLLTGLKTAPKGTIGICGLSLFDERTSIMPMMGVVFQQSTLDLDLTVQQNLFYHASLQGISPAQAMENITDILTALELNNALKVKVRTLNGGHRRRVEIVRALLHKPKILLLDEPTVGLDIESRALINKHVTALSEQEGLCVLWATHLMDEVALFATLIVLHGGQVKAQGIAQTLCEELQVTDVGQLYRKLTSSMELV